jgi:hypothetical protein
MSYNPVEFSVIAAACTAAGFAQKQRGKEITFERQNHHDPRLFVVVYTSTKVGAEKVRGKGKDAIRVALVATRDAGTPKERTFGIASATRVHRTGETSGILARLVSRMREMYGRANEMASPEHPHCPHCGAPCFKDSGKCVVHCYGSWKAGQQKQVAKEADAAPAGLPGLDKLTPSEVEQMNEVFG